MFPKVLIIGTTPYAPNNQSRAIDTYFRGWPKDNLRQIFSNVKTPMKGHCASYFQVTDIDVAKKLFCFKKVVGRILNYEDLPDNPPDFSMGKLLPLAKKRWYRYYARKMLWARKRWLTPALREWVEEFGPQIVFLQLSDDYFLLDISLYFAEEYKIPIVLTIGDDYYFAKRRNILLAPYFHGYRRLFDRIMNTKGFSVCISEKIARQYNQHFQKQGFPVYLHSSITSRPVGSFHYKFNYFGNLAIGRHLSLATLGDALAKVNPEFHVDVFCGNLSKATKRFLTQHNCVPHDAIPYEEVKEKVNSGSFNIIASGFRKQDIEAGRFSLSTKVADLLIAPGPILAIGPVGDGTIDYLLEKNCALVITEKTAAFGILKNTIYNETLLKEKVDRAREVSREEHDFSANNQKFLNACMQLIEADQNER